MVSDIIIYAPISWLGVFNHFCDQSQKQREVQRMEEESW